MPLCIAAALAVKGLAAHAATFTTITNCADDGSPGTLRSVIDGLTLADNNAVLDVSACATITLTKGELVVPLSAAILGPLTGTTTIDADHASRVIEGTGVTAATANLTLTSLTLRAGRVSTTDGVANGGCIAGVSVRLNNSIVTDCRAHSDTGDAIGGAINATSLTLYRSSIAANAVDSGAASIGGGIAVNDFSCLDSTLNSNEASGNPGEGGGGAVYASARIERCTIDTNAADYAGGLLDLGGGAGTATTTVIDSTISGNQASTSDGGLFAAGPLTILNSTITDNYAATCAGARGQHDAQVDSSLIARNFSVGPACVDLLAAGAITGTHNLVGTDNGGLPVDTIVADPRLAPLAYHGGFTRTHALLGSSPAIDAGNDAGGLATDQRGDGFERQAGPAVDIGAYERQPDDDETFYGGFDD